MTRWPSKPPAGSRCDGSTGVSYDLGHPTIIGCPNPAVETAKMRSLGLEMYVCETCADVFEAKGQIVRNPRRKKIVK